MAEVSAIEWTHATFNPWRGCRAVSPACDNCYAKVLVEGRLQQDFSVRTRAAASTWKAPLSWNRKAAKEGRRLRVFCASLADLFDAEVPDAWRDDLFALIAATPSLDWLLLTKRTAVARKYLVSRYSDPSAWIEAGGRQGIALGNSAGSIAIECMCAPGFFPHVWLGTTVENQSMAEARIPHLLETPAAVRFLSMEPLLGPVDLSQWLPHGSIGYDETGGCLDYVIPDPGLDWVITGGESGPGARPTHPDWFRFLRDQCAAAGVPFLFKQWGEWAPMEAFGGFQDGPVTDRFGNVRDWMRRYVQCADRADILTGHSFTEHATNLVYRVGKARAGRLLDGVLHDGYPVGA